MASVNTNFDNAIRGYAKMEEALRGIRGSVKEMQNSASEAKACLKDIVSQILEGDDTLSGTCQLILTEEPAG